MMQERMRGCAVGAAVGDALGMPLEFRERRPAETLVREMQAGEVRPLPAGRFTDDTEMALALAESLLARSPLDPADLAQRLVAWYRAGPSDIGMHTYYVLSRVLGGMDWEQAAEAAQQDDPESAGNGSVMRCWPVALAHFNDLPALLEDSRLQSRVTHPHPDCVAGCAFVNAAVYYLLHGEPPENAVPLALDAADVGGELRQVIEAAPGRVRDELENSGWVRHTLESAVWGLLTTDSFEEVLVQVVNLGNDADSAGAVVGALARAAYGLETIPPRWRRAVHGEWPVRSGRNWRADDLSGLADCLAQLCEG